MRLEYRLRDDVDVASYLPRVTAFAASLRADPACLSYQPFQVASDPRRFLHLGDFAARDGAFQSAAWFRDFTAHLRTLTVAPPDVLWLTPTP